ncbi:sensor histidine kinase [Deinococcus ficus]|uniref:sensor histidine kinase n=1 Tax=Deinococcus ficus TaxID=317577 RepID=UPI0003B5FBB9|nr:histidine kinase [Deinococcus ficus]
MTVSLPLLLESTRTSHAPPAAAVQEAAGEVRRTLLHTSLPIWAVLSLHSLMIEPVRDQLSRGAVLTWGTLNLVFLGTLLLTLRHLHRLSPPAALAALLGQSALLLTGNAFLNGSSIQAGLLVVVAAQVSLLWPFRQVLVWIAGQSLGLLWILHTNWQSLDAWAFSTGYVCIQLLAASSVRTAMREVQARRQLSVVVEELRATRELLNEASRQAERLHISRELHDVLGHQLTALGMHLQVGLHHLPPEHAARPHVQTAQAVGQQLLDDVRTTVRGMRASATCDFVPEVRRLTATDALSVQLAFSPGFTVTCPVTSLVLRRCVQEIMTNTLRHARAAHLWFTFTQGAQGIRVQAHDDGLGAPDLRFGCGLLGMRERLGCVGGQLHVDSPPGQGLRYVLTLPAQDGA